MAAGVAAYIEAYMPYLEYCKQLTRLVVFGLVNVRQVEFGPERSVSTFTQDGWNFHY